MEKTETEILDYSIRKITSIKEEKDKIDINILKILGILEKKEVNLNIKLE